MKENVKRAIFKIIKAIVPLLLVAGIIVFIFFLGYLYRDLGGLSEFPDSSGSSGSPGASEQPSVATDLWKEKQLKIHFLDVGQGDCTLIELPDGKKMMIDGGNGSKENNRKILNYLNAFGIKKLDYMLLTHADVDHSGGLESVLEEIPVSCAYLPYEATLTSEEAYLSLYRKVLQKVPAVNYSKRYLHIQGENYFLMFLSPKSLSVSPDMDDNENSAVVWLDYLGASALFCGDMTSKTETSILNEYTLLDGVFDLKDMKIQLESTEILKVAHHGSAYSSSLEWLEFLNFETAIISCGAGNSYGHPSSEALTSLRAASPEGEIYRTDECGDIVITVSADGSYRTVYENQSETLTALKVANELFGLTYVQNKLFYTEKFLTW